MGILDNLSSVLGSQTAGQTAAAPTGPVAAILAQALALLQTRPGGLGGLLQAFEQNGLGHLFQSWVGSGQNLPISADQIRATLGADFTGRIAQATGMAPEQVEGHLATVLPQIIDHLTPGGQLPQHAQLQSLLANAAQRFLHPT